MSACSFALSYDEEQNSKPVDALHIIGDEERPGVRNATGRSITAPAINRRIDIFRDRIAQYGTLRIVITSLVRYEYVASGGFFYCLSFFDT